MLQTERLDLRDFLVSDFDAVHSYAADPLVTRYTSWGPNTPDVTRDFLALSVNENNEVPRRNFTLAVIDRATGQLFGSCGIGTCDDTGRQFEVGYCLHRDWWGRGFGSEVAASLVNFGFEELEAHRIRAYVFAGNTASARILEGLGFRQEGVALQSLYVRSAWHDLISYARLSSE